MKTANHRSVLAGIAAGLAPSLSGAAVAPVSVSLPDAELIALCSQLDALERRWLSFFEAIEDDDEREAVQDPIVEEQDALLPRIYNLPPSMHEGAVALARLLALCKRKPVPTVDGLGFRQCCAAIKVRKPVNQDEKMFRRLQRREGEARPEAQTAEQLT